MGPELTTGAVRVASQMVDNAVAVSAGRFHSLALRSDGTVAGFGDNYLGKALGEKEADPLAASGTVRIDGVVLTGITQVAAAWYGSLALNADGKVAKWGQNLVPEKLANVTAVAADRYKSWALMRDGTIAGWVSDPTRQGYGELFSVDGISNAVAFAVGPGTYFTLGTALLRDGTVASWGRKFEDSNGNAPEGLSNVVAVAAGGSHSLALRSDGTVVGWGWNQSGEATGVPTTGRPNLANFSSGAVHLNRELLTNVISIAAGHGYSMALKQDGTVVAWGKMGDSQRLATVPEGLSNVVAIAAGAEDFCLAITTNKVVAERFMPAKP